MILDKLGYYIDSFLSTITIPFFQINLILLSFIDLIIIFLLLIGILWIVAGYSIGKRDIFNSGNITGTSVFIFSFCVSFLYFSNNLEYYYWIIYLLDILIIFITLYCLSFNVEYEDDFGIQFGGLTISVVLFFSIVLYSNYFLSEENLIQVTLILALLIISVAIPLFIKRFIQLTNELKQIANNFENFSEENYINNVLYFYQKQNKGKIIKEINTYQKKSIPNKFANNFVRTKVDKKIKVELTIFGLTESLNEFLTKSKIKSISSVSKNKFEKIKERFIDNLYQEIETAYKKELKNINPKKFPLHHDSTNPFNSLCELKEIIMFIIDTYIFYIFIRDVVFENYLIIVRLPLLRYVEKYQTKRIKIKDFINILEKENKLINEGIDFYKDKKKGYESKGKTIEIRVKIRLCNFIIKSLEEKIEINESKIEEYKNLGKLKKKTPTFDQDIEFLELNKERIYNFIKKHSEKKVKPEDKKHDEEKKNKKKKKSEKKLK